MITLNLRGTICDQCPYFSADEHKTSAYGDDRRIITNTRITCRNREFCERLENYLKKSIMNKL